EVPESQFEKALEGDIMFDGSSIEGFVRIEESDMVLKPDLDTFRVLPYDDGGGRGARGICHIYNPDGSAFAGCTRRALKQQIAKAKELGYAMMAGVEAEFFIFQLDAKGDPTTETHDRGGYFDLTPVDRAEEIRRLIIKDLTSIGLEVEAGHHEVAPAQHEIDFQYAEALQTADNLATFRFIVRNVAYRHGFLATFMPKPIFGQNGSGMHTHQSLFRKGANAYLALAVQLAAGLDGVARKLTPPDPVNENIFEMSFRERRKYRIDELPRDLHEALDMLEKDDVVRDALGPHIYERFVEAKREEWQEYIGRVSEWEVERYLAQY